MKILTILLIQLLSSALLNAQKAEVLFFSDTTGKEPQKSTSTNIQNQNGYGDLLHDDPIDNKKNPWWKPALGVPGTNVFLFSMDRYLFKYDFSTSVSLNSWEHNLRTEWAWDNDRFGVNFGGHPYTGAFYFDAARSNGYNYFQSFSFSCGGSLMWEYFGENTLPSYTDLINTTVNGSLLGEILYRLSSDILDDRTRGGQRVLREITAGIINPVGGIYRLLQGKSFRRTNKEIYQKEPVNITLYGGTQIDNIQTNILPSTRNYNVIINLQLEYGNPFELRKRKAFDYFRLHTGFSNKDGRKILDNVLGYGILFGKNAQHGKLAMLIGGFQYYDYWDNESFELMTIGFGCGVVTKLPISKTIHLYTNIHLAMIPLGANSGRLGPDRSQVRDYSYNNGLEGKFESTLILGKYVTTSLEYHHYFMHTYSTVSTKDYGPNINDTPGNNFISILKPGITVRLHKALSVGFEHYLFIDNRYQRDYPSIHSLQTKERIFLVFHFEDPKRSDHAN